MVSHSQYVCPDAYLSPLPSSFDAGTSPLALLEKTCLSVGHPDPPGKGSKSILNGDKSSPAKKDGGSQSSPDKLKNSSSPSADGKHKDTPGPSDKSERSSSVGGSGKTDENGNKTKSSEAHGETGKSGGGGGSRPTSAPTEPGNGASQPIPPSLPSLPTPGRSLPGFPSPYPGMPPFPHPAAFPSSFPHGLPSYPFSYSGFSPSLSGLGSFPRPGGLPCLDVNCKTCPPSPLAGRPCPLGCSHCTVPSHHGDLSMWLSYSSLFGGGFPQTPGSLFPGFGPTPTPKLPASLPSVVPTSSSASSTTSPHFCSWVTPTGICYQRFESSDELLQHVKTHTTTSSAANPVPSSSAGSSSASSAASTAAASSTTSVTSSMPIPGLGSPGSSVSSAGGRMSPRSAYLNALRFHPYGKPPHPGLPLGPPPPPFPPSLGGYSALSALYAAHRLPASLPHP